MTEEEEQKLTKEYENLHPLIISNERTFSHNEEMEKNQEQKTQKQIYYDTLDEFDKVQLLGEYNEIKTKDHKLKLRKALCLKIHHMDINKCRKNIRYFSKFEYPVFSVIDEPTNYNGETGAELYYIEKPNSYFPLRGNGWYHEPMINYCLK